MLADDALSILEAPVELRLFGCWDLRSRAAGSIELGRREQRLVALLALRGRRPRSQIAGTLWPDTTDERALTSLRSAVLRIRRSAGDLLLVGRSTLALADHVRVDVQEMVRCAADVEWETAGDPRHRLAMLRTADLLPGWYEDWVVFERERLQFLRLRALEEVARSALAVGHHDLALTAALDVIAVEPLRESAHAIAIRAHLLAGNRPGAVLEYQDYRRHLEQVLAIPPSREMDELLEPLLLPHPRQTR